MSYLTAELFTEAWVPYVELVKNSPGKSILEQQSVLLRFLSFSMLAKDLNEDTIDLSGYSENRSKLIANYQRLTSLGGNDQGGMYIEHQGKLTSRTPTAKVASDFLTSQLKKATESEKGKSSYPRRPDRPLLWLYKDWAVGFHEDWKAQLGEYILKGSSSPFHDLLIVLFHDEEFKDELNLKEALSSKCSELFSDEVAGFIISKLGDEQVSYEASPFSNEAIDRNWLIQYLGQSIGQSSSQDQIIGDFAGILNSNEERMMRELVSSFCADASNCNLRVDSKYVRRFLSSLLAKNFLIATGLSGSGKTKLAQAVAHWITPSSVEGLKHYSLVAVGADWVGNDNVLGYPNGLHAGSYVSKPALDLIIHAGNHPSIPHFLILDEMNLSHVERYFADMLSAIESGENLHLHTDDHREANGTIVPSSISLPKNLFIIGTVNVDETTYMFSPKVLDRANVLEFRMSKDELERFLESAGKPDLAELAGLGHAAGYGDSFVAHANDSATLPPQVKQLFDKELLLFFQALQSHGAEFGYRTAYEAGRFMHYYKLLGDQTDDSTVWFNEAFDCVVVQKLLPKLHGSRAKLGPVLKKLWFLCITKSEARGADALKAADDAARSTDQRFEPSSNTSKEAPYPLSAEKIARMWRLLMDNGFASFAEA